MPKLNVKCMVGMILVVCWLDLLLHFGNFNPVWASRVNVIRTVGIISVAYWFELLLSSGHFNPVWVS